MVAAIWAEMGLRFPPKVEPLPRQARSMVADANRLSIRLADTSPSWWLLHELAHAMTSTHDGRSDGHGPKFMGLYARLLTRYLRVPRGGRSSSHCIPQASESMSRRSRSSLTLRRPRVRAGHFRCNQAYRQVSHARRPAVLAMNRMPGLRRRTRPHSCFHTTRRHTGPIGNANRVLPLALRVLSPITRSLVGCLSHARR